MLLQQGDVLIQSIDKIPDDAEEVKAKNGRIVLAEGEATGHSHSVIAVPNIRLYKKDGVMYLKVKDDSVELKHEEHKKINIPSGNFEIIILKEYDHFKEEIINVVD